MNLSALELARAVQQWFKAWRRKLATAAVCVLALWVAYHVVWGANGMVAYQQKKAEHRAVQKEIEGLQKENERLEQEINGLKSNPKVIEREAREQLRYARPGETVYVIPGQKPTDKPPANATAEKK